MWFQNSFTETNTRQTRQDKCDELKFSSIHKKCSDLKKKKLKDDPRMTFRESIG